MLSIEIHKEKRNFLKPIVMGILNVTPDSFYDGGTHNDMALALRHCESMIAEGADIIDVGGFSTRPNGTLVSEDEERERIIPIIKEISRCFPDILISVDTFRASIAEYSLEAGAHIVNDISGGLFDEEMLPFIGRNHVPYIMMHLKGTFDTMHNYVSDEDAHKEVYEFFKKQCDYLSQYGQQQVILDPGIGFSKGMEGNFRLMSNLQDYRYEDKPILIGISRKSLIFKTLNCTPSESLNGTTVLNTIALMNGADILRVHDVKAAVEAVKLVERYKENMK